MLKKKQDKTVADSDQFVLDEKMIEAYGKRSGNLYTRVEKKKKTFDGFPRLSEYPTYHDLTVKHDQHNDQSSEYENQPHNFQESHDQTTNNNSTIPPDNRQENSSYSKSISQIKQKQQQKYVDCQIQKKQSNEDQSEQGKQQKSKTFEFQQTVLPAKKQDTQEISNRLKPFRASLSSVKRNGDLKDVCLTQSELKEYQEFLSCMDQKKQKSPENKPKLEPKKRKSVRFSEQLAQFQYSVSIIGNEKNQCNPEQFQYEPREQSQKRQRSPFSINQFETKRQIKEQQIKISAEVNEELEKIKKQEKTKPNRKNKKAKNRRVQVSPIQKIKQVKEQELRYPKRTRVKPMAFWKGEKLTYHKKETLKAVSSEEFFHLLKAKPSKCEAYAQKNLDQEQYIAQVIIPPKETFECYGFDIPFSNLSIKLITKTGKILFSNEQQTQELDKFTCISVSPNTAFSIENPNGVQKKISMKLFNEE